MEDFKSSEETIAFDDAEITLPASRSLSTNIDGLPCAEPLKQFLRQRFDRKADERFTLGQLVVLIAMALDDYSKIHHLRGQSTVELREILRPLVDALTDEHFRKM